MKLMTDEEKLEYRKRELPGYAEFIAVPEEQREAYVLNLVNEAFIKEGIEPLDRPLTDEEVQAEIEKFHTPLKKPNLRQRFCRAWAILWDNEG